MANKKSDIKSNVKSLYEIMKEEQILELDVNSKEYNLSIRRKDPNAGVVVERVAVAASAPKPAAPAAAKPAAKPASTAETIKSPITGVFYQAQTPSSPSFVNVGDIVEIGKTLCIVEAMKVMNEIKATSRVKILKIVAENGKPVNSGQPLFEIEKA